MKKLLILAAFLILSTTLLAQNSIAADTVLASQYFATAGKLFSEGQYDICITVYQSASDMYLRYKLWENYLNCRNRIGRCLDLSGQYDTALAILSQALETGKKYLGEKNRAVATSYNNIGIVYNSKGEFDKALEYYLKALKIREELFGEKDSDVAQSYNNVGVTFVSKCEYDKALEYAYKSLELRRELFGEKHVDVAASYNNIGAVLYAKGDYRGALDYMLRAVGIRVELFGEKHPYVAASYNNIGATFAIMGEYDKALEYELKALNLQQELYGDKYPDIAALYENIGNAYQYKGVYEKALEYLSKGLDIRRELFGDKHPYVAGSYYGIGCMYQTAGEYDKSLRFYHKGLIANIRDFSDEDMYANPSISNFIGVESLLNCLQGKGEAFLLKALKSNRTESEVIKDLNASYSNFILCDRLIQQMRKSYLRESEKLNWNENVKSVYNYAIETCLELLRHTNKHKYANAAFDYSEKSRMSALRDAIFDKEGLTAADIPDSILEKEHELRINISSFEKKIAEVPDSADEMECRSKLFDLNCRYDELIALIEKNYPEYYNLKYDNKNVSVEDLQKILDNKTAIRSYFVGDSTIFIFTLTQNNLSVKSAPKIKNLEDTIRCFREMLELPDESGSEKFNSLAGLLYKQLFPDDLSADMRIGNLVVIPDGVLSTIPFEVLLYDNKSSSYKNMSFLVKRFTISYAYSANIYYHTISGGQKRLSGNMNDWLAFAPVFFESDTTGISLTTKELQRYFKTGDSSSVRKRSLVLTKGRTGITPLPGTENEVKSILKEYAKNKLRGKVLLHSLASKSFLKSDEAKNYRVLHFATHGFVNPETPELSGILFAGDSTGGILSCGEIYNLTLNADLVVLSACETGLGKLRGGEGLMGLSRALLYAGARNLIVSLWQVSDNSTAELMLGFYRNMLKNKQKAEYAVSLREAKLKMIKEGKYAHPFYWSPFILIGR